MKMNYSRKARKLGWQYDEGGKHWFKPSETPLHCHGIYAKTAKEACEQSLITLVGCPPNAHRPIGQEG
jgi:hypothetical protein